MTYAKDLTRALLPFLLVGSLAYGAGHWNAAQDLTPPTVMSQDGQTCVQAWDEDAPKAHSLVCRTLGERYR